MRFTNRTEYGLICLVYLARAYESGKLATAKEIMASEKYALPFIEKILQSLRHAGIITSQKGKLGGYALARPPVEITFKHVIEALEGSTFEVFCEEPHRQDIVCNHLCLCGIKPVWKKTKELLDGFFETVTLDRLARHESEFRDVVLRTEAVHE